LGENHFPGKKFLCSTVPNNRKLKNYFLKKSFSPNQTLPKFWIHGCVSECSWCDDGKPTDITQLSCTIKDGEIEY